MNENPVPAAVSYELRDHEGRAYGHYQDETKARTLAEQHASSTGTARTVVRVETVWSSEAEAAAIELAEEERQRVADEEAAAAEAEANAKAHAANVAADAAAAKKATKATKAAG